MQDVLPEVFPVYSLVEEIISGELGIIVKKTEHTLVVQFLSGGSKIEAPASFFKPGIINFELVEGV